MKRFKYLYEIKINEEKIEKIYFVLYSSNFYIRNKIINSINLKLHNYDINVSFLKKDNLSDKEKILFKSKINYENEENKLIDSFNVNKFLNILENKLNAL